MLNNDAGWYASHMFKKYATLTAMDTGLDAAILMKFPDQFSSRARPVQLL